MNKKVISPRPDMSLRYKRSLKLPGTTVNSNYTEHLGEPLMLNYNATDVEGLEEIDASIHNLVNSLLVNK